MICCHREQAVQPTVELQMIWDVLIFMWHHCNDLVQSSLFLLSCCGGGEPVEPASVMKQGVDFNWICVVVGCTQWKGKYLTWQFGKTGGKLLTDLLTGYVFASKITFKEWSCYNVINFHENSQETLRSFTVKVRCLMSIMSLKSDLC